MKIGDVGKVGTNLQYRVGRIEYIHADSLIVRYKDNSLEKIAIEEFIPMKKVKNEIAVITSAGFDKAFRESLKYSDFPKRLKTKLFSEGCNRKVCDGGCSCK